MKTLGLIGGTGPENMIEWMGANELGKVTDFLVEAIDKLHRAGADFGALTANTPHIVFDDVQARSKLRLISIVEAACDRVEALGFKTVGLFGTRYTMQAPFYPKVFSRTDVKLVTPNVQEQEFIHDKYFNELLKDIFLPETRTALLEIAD